MAQLSSYLGWIDFSDEDQKRAQDYLRSLSEGTLDELGFGIIRGGFADLFFPATFTIMTRARYFILVPSSYLVTLQQCDHAASANRKCEQMELSLRKKLIENKSIENYDHRKTWVENELKRLAAGFGIDLLSFSILSNHFHRKQSWL